MYVHVHVYIVYTYNVKYYMHVNIKSCRLHSRKLLCTYAILLYSICPVLLTMFFARVVYIAALSYIHVHVHIYWPPGVK